MASSPSCFCLAAAGRGIVSETCSSLLHAAFTSSMVKSPTAMCFIQQRPVKIRGCSPIRSVEGRAKMEGSPVLCAKLLLGKGATEPQNAAFHIRRDIIPGHSRIIQMIGDVLVLRSRWRELYLVFVCILFGLARFYAALPCHAAIVTRGLSLTAWKVHFILGLFFDHVKLLFCCSKQWRFLGWQYNRVKGDFRG